MLFRSSPRTAVALPDVKARRTLLDQRRLRAWQRFGTKLGVALSTGRHPPEAGLAILCNTNGLRRMCSSSVASGATRFGCSRSTLRPSQHGQPMCWECCRGSNSASGRAIPHSRSHLIWAPLPPRTSADSSNVGWWSTEDARQSDVKQCFPIACHSPEDLRSAWSACPRPRAVLHWNWPGRTRN